jgi:glycosyltransferase involved in cell wall biosynthesis
VPRIGIDARKIEDGGIGRYVRELLRRLPALAPDATFVVLTGPGGAARLTGDRGLARNVETVDVGARGYSLREHLELGTVARTQRLDLLHAPHYVLPATATCPLIVTVHDLIHWRLAKTVLHGAYVRAMLALVRRRARLVLTPSAAVAHDLRELAAIDAARIRVIPNGVDAAFWGQDLRAVAETFARDHEIAPGYVLNVTNGLAHKGLDLLLEALRDMPEVRLVLAGRGSDAAAVRAQVAPLASRVTVLGELSEDELRLAYQAAGVVVVASRLEGFGLPALEAMAAGVPVVAAEAGALPEVVADAGLLFPVDSVACLRRALYRSMPGADLVERGERIRRGLARAREFTWDRTAQETVAAYRAALRWRT